MYQKHRRYYRSRQPDIFDMLVEIIAGGMLLIGKLIFRILRAIFQSRPKMRLSLQQKETFLTNSTPRVTESDPVRESTDSRYTLKHSLLTDAEKEFLKVLQQVVGDSYHIESQVQLSGIVRPVDSNERYTNYRDFNLIKAKSIDFVLYDRQYKPCLAIELDDRSHLRWDRIRRDQIVDEIMNDVGLRILHVQVSYSYDIDGLRRNIFTNS